MTLAKRLKQIRTRRSLSQTELAQKTRISQPMVSMLESGDAQPKVTTLRRLAKALDVSVSELLQ